MGFNFARAINNHNKGSQHTQENTQKATESTTKNNTKETDMTEKTGFTRTKPANESHPKKMGKTKPKPKPKTQLNNPKKNQNKKAKKIQKHRLPIGLVCAAALGLIPIFFFSLELALAGAGFLALAVYVFEEKEQNVQWNNTIKTSLKILSQKQEKLTEDISSQKEEINHMKTSLSQMAIHLDGQSANIIQKDPAQAMRLQRLAQKLSAIGRIGNPEHLTNLENHYIDDEPSKTPLQKNKKTSQQTDTYQTNNPASAQSQSALSQNSSKDSSFESTHIEDEPTLEELYQKYKSSPSPANDEPRYHIEGEELSDVVVKELMQNSLRNENVEVFIQPIMRLPQRQVRFYEIFGRIKASSGLYLPASRYMNLAKQEKISTKLDILLLHNIIKMLKKTSHIKKATPFFVNITRSCLKNKSYMNSLLHFLSKNRALASRLIFEMPHSVFDSLNSSERKIIKGLGTIGCNFSLDHVQVKDLDIDQLHEYKIRFVKLNAKTMKKEMHSDRSFAAMWKFKRTLEANSISVIADKIETENTLVELFDYDLHFGQGFLLGKPDIQAAYKSKKSA